MRWGAPIHCDERRSWSSNDEDCTGRTAGRKRAPGRVRRDGASCVLPHRDACPYGSRRDAVRQRGFQHVCKARVAVATCTPARRGHRRPDGSPHAHAGRRGRARGRVRYRALAHGLPAFPARPPALDPPRDDAARAARPARTRGTLRRIRRDPGRLRFERPAPAIARGGMGSDGLSRHPPRPLSAPRTARRRLPRLHRAHLAGKATRPRDRDRPADGHPAEGRSQDRCCRPRVLRSQHPPPHGRSARGIRRRTGGSRQRRLPGKRAGDALPHRLAGAVRARNDRGDGLRHACRRVSARLGAGGHRRGPDGVHRRVRGRGGGSGGGDPFRVRSSPLPGAF